MVTRNSATTTSSQQELVITRVFEAPRELVFRAWTDAKHVARWWGPNGFTNPVCEVDARPGGAMRIQMRGPDGVVFPGTGEFHEVTVPDRLVFTTRGYPDEAGNPQLEVLHTVTFTDLEGGKTKLTLRAAVVKAAAGVSGALAGMDEGWNQSLDRLAADLGGSSRVTSKDSTPIAFSRMGTGPALILVTGALGVRGEPLTGGLAQVLASHFTVYDFDRRGRGDSGDTPPYAIEREVEDIEALIDEAGGSAFLYGMSSGAVLALETVSRFPGKVKGLALYEPPFIIDDSRPPVPADYVEQVEAVLASDNRDKAVEMFMVAVGVPEEFIPMMREDPSWAEMEAVAHTLPYDFTIMRGLQSGKPLPPERVKQWTAATTPTLVIAGGNSEPFFHHAADLLVSILPNAQRAALEGQDHAVSGEALAPVLKAFFAK